LQQYITPYTPKQNSVFEHKNRTLVESTHNMFQFANLPNSFVGEVVATTCYLQNVSRISIMDEKTLYEACHWIGSKPNLQHLWIFGCLAYEHVLKEL